MGNIGYITRPTKELEIFYGQELVNGSKNTRALPVRDQSKVIFSGEPIIATPRGGDVAWEKVADAVDLKGDSGGTKVVFNAFNAPISFAYTDSTRFDVVSSGKLLGISSVDNFVLGTAFYIAGEPSGYPEGAPLYVTSAKLFADLNTGDTFCLASTEKLTDNFSKFNRLISDNVGALTTDKAKAVFKAVVGYVQDGTVILKRTQPGIKAQTDVKVNKTTVYAGGLDPEGYIRRNSTSDGKTVADDAALSGGPALWTEASKSAEILKFATKWTPISVWDAEKEFRD